MSGQPAERLDRTCGQGCKRYDRCNPHVTRVPAVILLRFFARGAKKQHDDPQSAMTYHPPLDVYDALQAHFGPQDWWPGATPLEIMVGSVLTQNTSWKNVEKAILNLQQLDLLDIDRLHACHLEELSEAIRPSGYFRVKAKRLWNLIDFVVRTHEGDLERMFATDQATLREQLLGISGIGPETADKIMLYAGELPAFVVDTYTARVVKRHGWIEPEADYHQLQEYFTGGLPDDVPLFGQYHALIVRVGNQHCSTKAKCEGCPLQGMLPESGVVELE